MISDGPEKKINVAQEQGMSPETSERRYEIEQEFVEKVENCEWDVSDKVNLLLVKAGVKPSALIETYLKIDETIWHSDEQLENIKSIVEASGLPFDIKESKKIEKYKKGTKKFIQKEEKVNILISRSREEFEHIKGVLKKLPLKKPEKITRKMKQIHKEIGVALGFPITAVEAFIREKGRKVLNKKKLPREVKESDAFVFSEFMLSKDNWQEEVQQGKIWADCVKSISPKVYQEMMDQGKELW